MFGKKDSGPLCGFDKRPCIKERCVQWVHIRGKNPQTGAEVDMPDCSFRWLPVLLIENAQETRQTAAAIESQRNSVASIALAAVGEVVQKMARQQAIAGHGRVDLLPGEAHCPGSFWSVSNSDPAQAECSVCGWRASH